MIFVKIGDSCIYLRAWLNFCVHAVWLTDMDEVRYQRFSSLSIPDNIQYSNCLQKFIGQLLHENLNSKGINKFLPVVSTFIVWYEWNLAWEICM